MSSIPVKVDYISLSTSKGWNFPPKLLKDFMKQIFHSVLQNLIKYYILVYFSLTPCIIACILTSILGKNICNFVYTMSGYQSRQWDPNLKTPKDNLISLLTFHNL